MTISLSALEDAARKATPDKPEAYRVVKGIKIPLIYVEAETILALCAAVRAAKPILIRMGRWFENEECECPPEGHSCDHDTTKREINTFARTLAPFTEKEGM